MHVAALTASERRFLELLGALCSATSSQLLIGYGYSGTDPEALEALRRTVYAARGRGWVRQTAISSWQRLHYPDIQAYELTSTGRALWTALMVERGQRRRRAQGHLALQGVSL